MAGYHNGTPVGRLARYVHIVSFEQISRFKESKDSLLQFIHKGTCNLDHDTRWRNVGHLRRCQLKRYGIHNHAHCCPYVGNTVTVKPKPIIRSWHSCKPNTVAQHATIATTCCPWYWACSPDQTPPRYSWPSVPAVPLSR